MVKYDEVAKIVLPKREAQAKAEATLEVALKGLRKKQDELKKVMDTLSELNARLKAMQAQKKQLQDEIESCELKIDRAFKLIKGLGGEKTRWTTAAEELGKAYTRVAGDMLGACCLRRRVHGKIPQGSRRRLGEHDQAKVQKHTHQWPATD